jgi:hypothetical protein
MMTSIHLDELRLAHVALRGELVDQLARKSGALRAHAGRPA